MYETIKIQNKINGNSLDKKLPTIISSPKKLESLSGLGETNPKILNPRDTWDNPDEYDAQAKKLIQMFIKNFEKFKENVDNNIKSSGPKAF